MSDMIPTGTRCARNLPQHFNGCSCATPVMTTAEADIDLDVTTTADTEPDRTDPVYAMSREEMLADPVFTFIPAEWFKDKTDDELAEALAAYHAASAANAAKAAEAKAAEEAETARRRRYRRPEWLHREDDGHALTYSTDDGYRATALTTLVQGRPSTYYCVRGPQGDEIANVDRVEQVQETIEKHREENPVVLTAPPSTNPKAAPFTKAATLESLADHYEALTSPENISWDGERSGAQVQAESARLQSAYWVRRDEIDPQRERAWCIACRAEVPGVDGQPAQHDNDLGRSCWTGS